MMNADKECVSFADAIEAVPDGKLKTLTQSAIPFLSYWRNERQAMEHVFQRLNMNPVDYRLVFEYAHSSSEIPACADLMMLSENVAVAFHSRWMSYPPMTVSEWVARDKTEDRKRAVSSWVSTIESVSKCKLRLESFSVVPFCLLQCAAVVCSVPAKRRVVYSQVFVDGGVCYIPMEYLRGFAWISQLVPSPAGVEFKMDVPIDIKLNRYYRQLERKVKHLAFDETPSLIRRETVKHSLFKIEYGAMTMCYSR